MSSGICTVTSTPSLYPARVLRSTEGRRICRAPHGRFAVSSPHNPTHASSLRLIAVPQDTDAPAHPAAPPRPAEFSNAKSRLPGTRKVGTCSAAWEIGCYTFRSPISSGRSIRGLRQSNHAHFVHSGRGEPGPLRNR
jgi:hypothetical protein